MHKNFRAHMFIDDGRLDQLRLVIVRDGVSNFRNLGDSQYSELDFQRARNMDPGLCHTFVSTVVELGSDNSHERYRALEIAIANRTRNVSITSDVRFKEDEKNLTALVQVRHAQAVRKMKASFPGSFLQMVTREEMVRSAVFTDKERSLPIGFRDLVFYSSEREAILDAWDQYREAFSKETAVSV